MELNKLLRFNDFYDIQSYCNVQYYFISYDERNPYAEKFDKPLESKNPEIIYKEWDMFSGLKETYEKKYFLEDFLLPSINKMSTFYLKIFKRDLYGKFQYNEESMLNFSKSRLSLLNAYKAKLSSTDYLGKEILDALYQQLEIIISEIEMYIANPFPFLTEKLQFIWNKADILYFFYLLRENNQISYISNADLGRILDNIVEYRKNEEFHSITDAGKRLSGFNQKVPIIVKDSKKRLLEIFSNPDYYKN
jgi:hypothetical protein